MIPEQRLLTVLNIDEHHELFCAVEARDTKILVPVDMMRSDRTPAQILNSWFNWRSTPQGHVFWSNIKRRLECP